MDNIINLKFDNNPDPGDYIEFKYDTNGDGNYEIIKLIFVSSGNRFIPGEFEIQPTVDETIEAFGKYFINDYQMKVNDIDLFNVRVDQETVVRIENILGGFSDLVISSPSNNLDGELTSNVMEGINEITFIFSSNPDNGDSITFNYYPNYPDISTTSTILIDFISGVPSNFGEVQIGSTLNQTYENIIEWLGRYYNNNGQFDFYIHKDIDTNDYKYLSIRTSNLSPIKDLVSTIDENKVDVEMVNRSISQSSISDFILTKSPKIIYNTSSSNYKRFRFSLRLLSNPTSGESFSFNIKQNDINKIFYLKYFRISGTGNNDVIIGVDINDTIGNLYNNLIQYNDSELVEYDVNNNIIYIDIYDGDDNEYSIEMISNDANIEYYGPVVDGGDRGYDHTIFKVDEWEGLRRRFTTEEFTSGWTINKPLISDTQNQTYINVSPLVGDRFESNLNNYLSGSPVLPLAKGTSKWVGVSSMNKLVELNRDFKSRIYYALDGWSEDGSNIVPRVLLTGGKYVIENNKPVRHIRRTLHRGAPARIFYQTALHNGHVSVFGKHSYRTIGNVSGNSLNNREFLKSVKVPYTDYLDNPFIQTITMVFGYSRERFPSSGPAVDPTIETTKVTIDIIEECRYPVVWVVFKNRYGVLETLTFGMVSKRELKTSREDYSRSVMDINGNVNLNRHNNKPFNINGQEEYTLNTGHVKEYMNEAYTDLFISDEIYLKCDSISKFVPVNLIDNDFDRKRRVNVGLINYTFRFRTSYNKNYNYN